MLRIDPAFVRGDEPLEKQMAYATEGSTEMRRRLAEVTEEQKILAFLSEHDKDAEVLEELAHRVLYGDIPDKYERENLADAIIKNEHAPFAVHDAFSREKQPGVRALVAFVTKYRKVLERLSRGNEDYQVIESYIKNEHGLSTSKALSRLSRHKNPIVREAVAECIRTPEKCMRILCDDEDEGVRKAAKITLEKLIERDVAVNFFHMRRDSA